MYMLASAKQNVSWYGLADERLIEDKVVYSIYHGNCCQHSSLEIDSDYVGFAPYQTRFPVSSKMTLLFCFATTVISDSYYAASVE